MHGLIFIDKEGSGMVVNVWEFMPPTWTTSEGVRSCVD